MFVEKHSNLIITDPCYLFSGSKEKWENYSVLKNGLPNHHFRHSISESTLYGDWSCTVFKEISGKIQNIEDIGLYVESVANDYANNANDEFIGKFCSDSGMVCVVYADEVLKFNPNFETNECYVGSHYDENGKFIQGDKITESTYRRLATIIKDFQGEIKLHDFNVEETTHRSVIGFGNYNFYTLQTGF